MLLILVFVTLSVVPQAMAQSCGAERAGYQSWLQTQPSPSGNYRVSFTTATNRVDELHIGYLPSGDTTALQATLPRLSANLSLTDNHHSASASPQRPRGAPPVFNWWCYMQCLRMGGNVDDCSILCSGKPVQQ
jgi:hypothetical protein